MSWKVEEEEREGEERTGGADEGTSATSPSAARAVREGKEGRGCASSLPLTRSSAWDPSSHPHSPRAPTPKEE
jgi:hypothetical protein